MFIYTRMPSGQVTGQGHTLEACWCQDGTGCLPGLGFSPGFPEPAGRVAGLQASGSLGPGLMRYSGRHSFASSGMASKLMD